MVQADIFNQVLWQFLSPCQTRFRIIGRGGGSVTAAEGGEMGSNYFKNTEPVRKLQVFGCRLASLGDQIIRNLGRKIELAILKSEKENFKN